MSLVNEVLKYNQSKRRFVTPLDRLLNLCRRTRRERDNDEDDSSLRRQSKRAKDNDKDDSIPAASSRS